MSNVALPAAWYGTIPRQRAASIGDHFNKVLVIKPPGEYTTAPLPNPPCRLTIILKNEVLVIGPSGEFTTKPTLTIMPSAKPRQRRKPTLTTVAKQAAKANIEVQRFEVRPDGTVVVVPGKPENNGDNITINPWDEVLDDGTH